ncbi:MAG TPA: hypothetical protein VGK74_19130 [Symbiobacteriaceae bacterium]
MLEDDMKHRRFHQALETMRRILGDMTLPPASRLEVKLKELEALLGVGRVTEAFVQAHQAEAFMVDHGLWKYRDAVREFIERTTAQRQS